VGERLAFLLGKDPATSYGGDVTMFATLRSIAEERFETELICLSDQPSLVDDQRTVRVAKPPLSPPRLLLESARNRRSLVHTRFDADGIRDAVERSTAERFVAVHSYMAEPFLRAAGVSPSHDLLISTEVSESAVWRRTRGPVGRLEARRLDRDEWRVARLARAVGGYDRDEIASYAARGLSSALWLPVTLPPAAPVDVASTPPRLVLLGNRTWPPNARAAEDLLAWWPEISAGVPDAELWLVGPGPEGRSPALPPGVSDLGIVEDMPATLAACRGLVAPISVGGGVRVKVLEAAARGLPVVLTRVGVGPIEAALGIEPAADRADFVAQCRTLLLDPASAAEAGARLHAANTRRWAERHGQDAVLGWLGA
jgi:glycosyltransferase involved in cell wall biosynthesis